MQTSNFTHRLRLSFTVIAAATMLCAATSSRAEEHEVLADSAAAAALASAEKTADELNAKVCIAVVDAGGMLKAFKRMDGAAPGCVDSAIAKARAAAIYRIPTLAFMNRVNHGEPAIATLPGMVPLGGGVPAKANDIWVGAVGAAGSANPNEVKIATAGADTLSHP